MVPHLITALTGPINELEQRVIDSMPATERWFRLEWMEHTPPIYSAVRLRNAGFKIAPINADLFPGGWDRLTPEMLPLAVQAAMAAIEKICPEARNLLIVPDGQNHSPQYLRNLVQLQRVFHMAGLNVRVGSISPEIKKTTVIDLPDGENIAVEPVLRERGRLGLKNFDPCTILLNNHLSAGAPGILEELHGQYLLPPLHAGSSVRRRSNHCRSYEEVSKRFGKLLGIDPWLIQPMFSRVDLGGASVGIDALQASTDALLGKIRRKYKEYGIQEKPFVLVRADNSASGMEVTAVRDAKELEAWMELPKLQSSSVSVLVQEGVLAQERIEQAVAEPMVYMLDRYVVGGGYHIIPGERAVDKKANALNDDFVPLAFQSSQHLPQSGASAPNRFYMYGVIARLAMLAASYELEATDPEAEMYD